MNAASWIIVVLIAAFLVAVVLKSTVFKGPRWMRKREKERAAAQHAKTAHMDDGAKTGR